MLVFLVYGLSSAAPIQSKIKCFCLAEATCSSGWPIVNHGIHDSSDWTFVSPSKYIQCNGFVVEWRYVAERLYPFKAVIWRKVEGFPSKFKVVGINEIPVGSVTNQEITYTVPENERISVKAGDVIGWSHGPALLSWILGGNHLTQIQYVSRINQPTLEENQIVAFSHLEDRHYSIQVTVQAVGK